MPYYDSGERPWFCSKPGCHKLIWETVRDHQRCYHQKMCLLKFPDEAPFQIERDVTVDRSWRCPRCEAVFPGTTRGVRDIQKHAKSGECLLDAPMDVESRPPSKSAVAEDSGIEQDGINPEWDTKDDSEEPMDIAPDASPAEYSVGPMPNSSGLQKSRDEQPNLKVGVPRSLVPSSPPSASGGAPQQAKAELQDLSDVPPPSERPVPTIATFLADIPDYTAYADALDGIFAKHGFKTMARLDAVCRYLPQYRTDNVTSRGWTSFAEDIQQQTTMKTWLQVRKAFLDRAKVLGVDAG